MANRIKGITVEIGGDTTKLSKSLEGVNKTIKNTQTQLKDVEKLLKLDPYQYRAFIAKAEIVSRCCFLHKRKTGNAENRRGTSKYCTCQR
ncbi:MAG: hypothetical protein NC244_10830 [Alistipes senegalensis]|nr:hypothetical protein [Alistipes senegalensis]